MEGVQEISEMELLLRHKRRQSSDIAQVSDFVDEGDRSGSGVLREPNVSGEKSDSYGEADEANKSDDQPMDEQANLTEIIEHGEIDDIRDNLTPKALTKGNKNVLMMAMETSFNLRRRASKKGPSEDDFTKLANSVDKFSTCLLDPLKSQIEARHAFGDSIDDVMDAAINLEQKELLAHPVLFNLLANKWFGKFDKLHNTSSSTFERLQWIFLNFWCLFDLVMFPLFFALLYVWNKLFAGDQKLENREMEVAFLMSATSDLAHDAFEQMKKVVEQFIEEHGNTKDGYQIIIHDKKSHAKTIHAEELQDLQKGNEEYPALHRNLKIAAKYFFRPRKSDVDKVIIYFTDDRVSLKRKLQRVQSQARSLGKEEINLLPVGIGRQIDIKELKDITKFNKKDLNVIHVGEYENPETVRKIISHELQGKRIYESYLEYFTTPYFIFVRDTLSYVALLALHFALCLSPSSLPLNGLEWAILVFFLGRILMEIQQIVTIRKKEDKDKDKESKFARKSTAGKYFSDRWNVLDFITLLIYVPTLILRIITWSLSNSVTNNRAIVIGGYLYGVNTMLLTLRAFGHVMETIKGVGVVQIALFHIIGDIATIMWQFIAAILAFSISITKVYMAERSYISKESHKESLVCETPGLSCWWTVVEHLCWSLLGMSELDPLDSVDHPSETIARFLFGLFLVLGVILLINMMIALLSNTYQRVQDNSLREWSFKKAVTIQTYSNYHPVPVPFNIFWCLWLLCRKCYQRCMGCRERQGDANDGEGNNSEGKRKSLDFVVRNLQMRYFETYGDSFPVTDDTKIDQIFHETRQNQQMTNQLAYGTFMTSASDESALPVGQEAWDASGITVDGCRLSYQGETTCETCKINGPVIYHGARYRIPFSREFSHFKVLVQGNERFMGVGVVWKDYGKHDMPGWREDTVGYIVNQGKVFDPCYPKTGREYENAIAYRGDEVGCSVDFGFAENPEEVEIVFTLNGKRITQDKIRMPHNVQYCGSFSMKIYPYVCLTTPGMTVLAKMCSSKTASPQLVSEDIMAITQATSHITEIVNTKFEEAKRVIDGVEMTLNVSQSKDEEFMKYVAESLERFGISLRECLTLLKEERRRRSTATIESMDRVSTNSSMEESYTPTEACSIDDFKPRFKHTELAKESHIDRENVEFVNKKDGAGLEDLEPLTDLLKKAGDDLANVKKTTSDRFDLFFESLGLVKNRFENIITGNENKRREITIQLRELKCFIERDFSSF